MTSLLDAPLISETRRNHAIEHATLHILSDRFPGRHMAGHSNPTGFLIFGDVPLEDAAKAATEALARLQQGERNLAIHPGCGTNYLVAGAMGGGLAWITMLSARNRRERMERLLPAIMMATFGFVLAQPVGPLVQERITTDGDPGSMVIEGVYALRPGLIRVVTHK
jgi:uncharacterized protein DUF6391